jgi:hypothetical protein
MGDPARAAVKDSANHLRPKQTATREGQFPITACFMVAQTVTAQTTVASGGEKSAYTPRE